MIPLSKYVRSMCLMDPKYVPGLNRSGLATHGFRLNEGPLFPSRILSTLFASQTYSKLLHIKGSIFISRLRISSRPTLCTHSRTIKARYILWIHQAHTSCVLYSAVSFVFNIFIQCHRQYPAGTATTAAATTPTHLQDNLIEANTVKCTEARRLRQYFVWSCARLHHGIPVRHCSPQVP